MTDSRIELATRQIEFARSYTLSLLEDVDEDKCFLMPEGFPTHLAWQVGHMAMAEYGLALFRQRGRQPIDVELMNSKFRKQFSRGSVPNPDPEQNPSWQEIREIFDAVHRQVLSELPTFAAESLDEPVDMPYTGYANKYGALLFCSHHEMIHAGQIGMLRRLLGNEPVR